MTGVVISIDKSGLGLHLLAVDVGQPRHVWPHKIEVWGSFLIVPQLTSFKNYISINSYSNMNSIIFPEFLKHPSCHPLRPFVQPGRQRCRRTTATSLMSSLSKTSSEVASHSYFC